MSKRKQTKQTKQTKAKDINKRILKIAVMPMADDGCSHYRINKPYKEMERLGLAQVEFFKSADLETDRFMDYLNKCDLVVCRAYHSKAILDVIDTYFDVKVLVDIDDDLFDIDPYNESYSAHGTKEVKHGNKWLWKHLVNINIMENKAYLNSVKKLLKRADIISVSTERLKEKMLEYNKNVIINFNAIDSKDWIYRDIKKSDEIRIGWTGGASHYKDWLTVQDDIIKIMKEYPQVKLVIGGIMFEGVFKKIPKERIEYYDWVRPEAHGFRTALMNLDIAIIPLEYSQFNSNKSCIKFYEFSSLKVPTICSNVPPYSDEVPVELLFEDLYSKIKPFIENKNVRDKIGDIQYNWVMKNRDLKKVTEELYNNIKSLV